MKQLYEMGATDAAKRELWDMCVIAEGGTPLRNLGGADVEFKDGELNLKKELSVGTVTRIDKIITVDSTKIE